MTTAYTSLLGLALPVTGELSGTWGDTVNNSITSLLDSAIAGTTTLSADTTLTTTTGASNQARQAILLCTGHVANITITAPAQSKIYTVINASATYTAKIRGVGPTTGITIPVSSTATVAWNGSDFVDASGYINGNLKVNGTLSVTGVATFAAGSAALPAITTTGDTNTGMWFPAADTIAFTEGGVESMRIDSSGNVGIGTTLPGSFAAAGRNLVVGTGTGNNGLTIYSGNASGGNIYFADGTTGAETYAGFIQYAHSTNAMLFGVNNNGSESMTLNSSGNLSIGATSTTSRLLAAGAGNNILGNAYSVASFLQDTTTARGVFLGYDSTGQIGTVSASSNGAASNLAFWTYSGSAWAEKARIDSSGNLGIGVTSPVSILDVNAKGTGTTPNAVKTYTSYMHGSTIGTNVGELTGWGVRYGTIAATPVWYGARFLRNGVNAASDFTIWTSPDGDVTTLAERVTVTASGNVGIAATSPVSRLDVRAASDVIGNYQTIQALSTDSAAINLGGGIGLGGFYSGTSSIAVFGNIVGRKENGTGGNYAGYLAFGTNAQATGIVERARIDSSGNLLVGTTAATGLASNQTRVVGGILNTASASALSVANNTATTIFTLSDYQGSQSWIVSADVAGQSNASAYACVYLVVANYTGAASVTALRQGSLSSISVSGLDVKYTQASGGTQTSVQWSAIRIM